jgi:hypothetical protein
MHRALFEHSIIPPTLRSDWIEAQEPQDDLDLEQFFTPDAGLISPFDYLTTDDSWPYVWCEELIVRHVWNSNYSWHLLGGSSRPPMSAVARDMIQLVSYLATIKPDSTPMLFRACLKGFLVKNRPFAVARGEFDQDWACQGYLYDVYRTAIAWYGPKEVQGLDSMRIKPKVGINPKVVQIERLYYLRSDIDNFHFPGGETVELGPALVDEGKSKELYGSLEIVNASVIESGPFKMGLTGDPAMHLTLQDNKVLIFCEDKREEVEKDGQKGLEPGTNVVSFTPAYGGYGLLNKHTLGEYPHCKSHC